MGGISASHGFIALLTLVSSTAARSEAPVYECGRGESAQHIRIEGGEWFSRPAASASEPMQAKGCGSERQDDTYKTEIRCASDDRMFSVYTQVTSSDGGFDITEQLHTADLRLVVYGTPGAFEPRESACRLVDAAMADTGVEPKPATIAGLGLGRQIAAGAPFVIITKQEALRLKPGNWHYPFGSWVVIEGRYHPDKGLWAVSGVGFAPRGNPLHSCPAEIRCGGIHEEGFALDRWYRPEDHELVAFGQKFTFDEAGNLFSDGAKIGRLVVPGL
jgi:hypothetical protein